MHTDNGAEAGECRILDHEREIFLEGLETLCISKWNLYCFLLVENRVGSVLNKEARYSTKEEIRILVDILTASILENETCPGPFSGTEANWHGTAWVHTAKLPGRQGGRRQTA